MESIIGREAEIRTLTEIAGSGRPEFVAVYGRRRVGKTFLVRSVFKDKLKGKVILDYFNVCPLEGVYHI